MIKKVLFLCYVTLGNVMSMIPESFNKELVAEYGNAPDCLVQIAEDVADSSFKKGADKIIKINKIFHNLNVRNNSLYFKGDNVNNIQKELEKIYIKVNNVYKKN